MSNGEYLLKWNHPLMKLVITTIVSLLNTWYTSNTKMAIYLRTLLTNASLMHKPQEIVFYDAHETEVVMSPENTSHPFWSNGYIQA
jgi:hypothetical protein